MQRFMPMLHENSPMRLLGRNWTILNVISVLSENEKAEEILVEKIYNDSVRVQFYGERKILKPL